MLTIGIPTYNRSAFLRAALASALQQTSKEVKIVVLDNASTDDTEKMVREYGPRVRYERNTSNIGLNANFNRLVEYCDTEYFSWLQDDDCLHPAFAERALGALRSDSSVKVYSAYALVSHGMLSHYKPQVYGPPFPVDFLGSSGVRIYDGRLLAPFSLFMSVTFPPVAAFRTEDLRAYLRNPTGMTTLFAERSWALHAVSSGSIAVDPFIGAIIRVHPGQGQNDLMRRETKEWNTFAKDVDQLVATWDLNWLPAFSQALLQTETAYRTTWLQMSEGWPQEIKMCRLVAQALRDSLPKGTAQQQEGKWKVFLRDLVPPVLWKGLGWGKQKWLMRCE
jgi:glycosyltransferase involved in cell wall biosynthesis